MVVRCWVFGLFRFAWGQKIGHKAWWCLGICRMLSRLVDFFLEELIISGIGPKALCASRHLGVIYTRPQGRQLRIDNDRSVKTLDQCLKVVARPGGL